MHHAQNKNVNPPQYGKHNDKKLFYLLVKERKKIRYLSEGKFLQLTLRLNGNARKV